MINWVKIDIVVWFFPAVIILILDDFVYLNYQRYAAKEVKLSVQGRQLFAKLKLFSLVSLFIYNIMSENKQKLMGYEIWEFSLNQVDNSIFRDYFLLQFLALVSAILISIGIFYLIDSLTRTHPYLIEKEDEDVKDEVVKDVKYVKYNSSRRLHKKK